MVFPFLLPALEERLCKVATVIPKYSEDSNPFTAFAGGKRPSCFDSTARTVGSRLVAAAADL